MKYFKAFSLAFNMLTIIPFFRVHDFYKGINGLSAVFYPFIGLILGSILFLTHLLLEPYLPSIHLAILLFSLWVILTGALHLDGFSDTIDGLFVPEDKALKVMKDAHVGGMGMTFTVVFLLLKLSSFVYFALHAPLYLLPLFLMFSRFNAVAAIYLYPYISSGVGKLLKEELHLKYVLFALFYTLAISIVFNSLDFLLISLVSLLIAATFFQRRLGGLNGDIYGFIIELSELFMLNYLIIKFFT